MGAVMECIAVATGIACAPMQPNHTEPPVVQPDAYVLYLDTCMRQKVKEFADGMLERGASSDAVDRHVTRLLAGEVHDTWLRQCRNLYESR